ncbi:MAG: hypothetical protein JWM80_5416 [Cyanobacteria bacterium RYN_339]|nr:hypothetical protein [Cyanobacteria bacterium RYN_339]
MFGLWGAARYYRTRRAALDATALAAVREAILDAPFMSTNNLNERFAGTYGFSVCFRRDGLPEVLAAFPAFEPYLRLALAPRANAFFLNPLLIADGAAVHPHIDLSLSTYCPEVTPPEVVSVLYVSVPTGLQGGALNLYQGERRVASVPPVEGTLLDFRGNLRHEVEGVRGGAPTIYDARLSLVMEQYSVPDETLERAPRFQLGTRRAAAGDPPLAGGAGEGAFGDEVRRALES